MADDGDYGGSKPWYSQLSSILETQTSSLDRNHDEAEGERESEAYCGCVLSSTNKALEKHIATPQQTWLDIVYA